MLTIEQISCGFGRQEILHDISLSIPEGKITAIVGQSGCGKTTFLNVLSDYVPDDERVITIEDSAELQLHNINNIVRLEARVANLEGTNAVSIRDLIKASLRMRPDRIVVGEVRGAEAIDMLQAIICTI